MPDLDPKDYAAAHDEADVPTVATAYREAQDSEFAGGTIGGPSHRAEADDGQWGELPTRTEFESTQRGGGERLGSELRGPTEDMEPARQPDARVDPRLAGQARRNRDGRGDG